MKRFIVLLLICVACSPSEDGPSGPTGDATITVAVSWSQLEELIYAGPSEGVTVAPTAPVDASITVWSPGAEPVSTTRPFDAEEVQLAFPVDDVQDLQALSLFAEVRIGETTVAYGENEFEAVVGSTVEVSTAAPLETVFFEPLDGTYAPLEAGTSRRYRLHGLLAGAPPDYAQSYRSFVTPPEDFDLLSADVIGPGTVTFPVSGGERVFELSVDETLASSSSLNVVFEVASVYAVPGGFRSGPRSVGDDLIALP